MLEKLLTIWPDILDAIKNDSDLSITSASFNNWIKPLIVHSVDGDKVTLIYPNKGANSIALTMLYSKYIDILTQYICIYMDHDFYVDIKLANPSEKISAFNDLSIPENESLSLQDRIIEANLKREYTFDSFIVGNNNNAAQVMALAAAECPGSVYNPLYIYGGVGLGKTHLIQAIGNFVLENNDDMTVLYTTTESFTNEIVDLLRKKETTQEQLIDFRNKYRKVDTLLIDDIQFISGKDRTQEELFNIFNELFLNNKQIVITSDKKPKELDGIEERLISRFQQGLSVDIQKPDYETRLAILKKKTEEMGYEDIDDDVYDYIAKNFVSNIRELEGCLKNLDFYSKLNHRKIDLDFAMETLKDLLSPDGKKEITCDSIISVVAEHYNISVSDICSQSKMNEVAYPRQICMYLCRKYTNETLKAIALTLRHKNHATISHGYNKIKNEMETNPELRETINTLVKKLDPS